MQGHLDYFTTEFLTLVLITKLVAFIHCAYSDYKFVKIWQNGRKMTVLGYIFSAQKAFTKWTYLRNAECVLLHNA